MRPSAGASRSPRAARRTPPRCRCRRTSSPAKTAWPSLPTLPIAGTPTLHQLHAVRPALHADRGAALRPAQHQHGAVSALRGLSPRVCGPARPQFHAEPVACPACGPHLRLVVPGQAPVTGDAAAVAAAVALPSRGPRARGARHRRLPPAVRRARRGRSASPARAQATAGQASRRDFPAARRRRSRLRTRGTGDRAVERAALLDPARPIVLVPRRADGRLAPSVAPGSAKSAHSCLTARCTTSCSARSADRWWRLRAT